MRQNPTRKAKGGVPTAAKLKKAKRTRRRVQEERREGRGQRISRESQSRCEVNEALDANGRAGSSPRSTPGRGEREEGRNRKSQTPKEYEEQQEREGRLPGMSERGGRKGQHQKTVDAGKGGGGR